MFIDLASRFARGTRIDEAIEIVAVVAVDRQGVLVCSLQKLLVRVGAFPKGGGLPPLLDAEADVGVASQQFGCYPAGGAELVHGDAIHGSSLEGCLNPLFAVHVVFPPFLAALQKKP